MKEPHGPGSFVLRSPHAVCELVKSSKRNKDGVLIAELKDTIWIIKLNYLVLSFNLWIHHLNFMDFLTMKPRTYYKTQWFWTIFKSIPKKIMLYSVPVNNFLVLKLASFFLLRILLGIDSSPNFDLKLR